MAIAASCNASRWRESGRVSRKPNGNREEGSVQEQLIAMALAYAPKALVAVAMLAAGWFTARWISAITGHRLERYDIEPPVRALLLATERVLILGLFVIMALHNIG